MTTDYLEARQSALADAVDTVDAHINDGVAEVNALDADDPARVPLQNTVDDLQQIRDQLSAEQARLAAAEHGQLTDSRRRADIAGLAGRLARR